VNKQRFGMVLGAVTLLFFLLIASVQAQVQSIRWSEPYRLSSNAGKSSEGYLVADQYGFVHCFWTEVLHEDQRSVIRYARFDGTTWSPSNDIYITGEGIENVSPVVDPQGTLHVAWAEGLTGPAYYTYAPAYNALRAQSWARPTRINIPARALRLRIDSKGIFHIVYINQVADPGVYYVRSEDQGLTWSDAVWLDPDILPDHVPDSLNFELDEADGLHAAWFYGALEPGAEADWVRYTHSFNGGHTWSSPLTIDQADEERGYTLTNASPKMIVEGETVHVIWAAGALPYRHHRFSSDAGLTWSPPRRLFDELHGQAFDGLTVDGAGRVHLFSQIRYPMGIYHAFWDETEWSSPALVYLIAQEGSDTGDRIHAHHTYPVVRANNQLVLTFADGPSDPNRRLFAMQRMLDDVLPATTVPTPTPTFRPVAVASPTPIPTTATPTATATAPFFGAAAGPVTPVAEPGLTLELALLPTLLLLVGTVVFRWWWNRHKFSMGRGRP
jgi:hypothetical protein